ncbi:MAG: serine/threonine-protein phosphatase, partial [Pseudomonas sp.]|nr:serine/threonine-protein phosphatase [Pseudomonas sp.]
MRSTFKSASKSHVGMVRQVNEDACLDLPENGLWVVADGMGGHAAGDYVSSLIVDSLRSIPVGRSLEEYTAALRSDLLRVNGAVREETAHRGVTMMGSTVVLLATRGLRGVCLWA